MSMFSPAIVFLVLGVALVSIEIVAFQLSVFWVMFIGLGALAAAATGFVLPQLGWAGTGASFVIYSLVITVVLLRPLRKWQNKAASLPGNDAIGQQVRVTQAITAETPGQVSWSGARWNAQLAPSCEDKPIAAGASARIAQVEGITLYVDQA